MKLIAAIFLIIYIPVSMFSQNTSIMSTQQTPITGNETPSGNKTPQDALIQFYDAFNNGKMDLMSQNWANTSDIAMDNPLGGIMRGWENIGSIYQRIFEGKAKVYVEFYDYTIHETDSFFYTVGRERGQFEIEGQTIQLAIRTSRIFQKINGVWRQVHHHGSIEDPKLLDTYQKMVRK